jgi:hypothetical protein
MIEPSAPERIAVVWSPEARVELRPIDRETALQILHCLDRYLGNRTGPDETLKRSQTYFKAPLKFLP